MKRSRGDQSGGEKIRENNAKRCSRVLSIYLKLSPVESRLEDIRLDQITYDMK